MQGENTTNQAPEQHYAAQAAPALATELAQQIARWKQQHRDVLQITVEVGPGDQAICYLKPADRNIIAFALKQVMSKNLLEAGEFLLRNCWLGGDERMQDGGSQADDRIIVAAAIEAAGTIDLLSAASKKL